METHLNCNDIMTLSTLQMLNNRRAENFASGLSEKIINPTIITDNLEKRNQINIREDTIAPQQRIFLQPPQFGLTPYNSPSIFGFSAGLMTAKRPRGEKKPIPEEQKDDRYFERRKRNNQAAKKSRDARRIREDQIAFRATFLEQENAVLRAQILTLREEIQSIRQLLLMPRKPSSFGICLPTSAS